MVLSDALAAAGIGGILAGFIVAFFVVFLIGFLAVYIYTALALMAIAKKTKTQNSWMAWIPIANYYLITQMAGLSGLWTLILLAVLIPNLGGLVVMGITIWMFWRIAQDIDMPGWTSLLLLIPVLNLVILGIYAWKK